MTGSKENLREEEEKDAEDRDGDEDDGQGIQWVYFRVQTLTWNIFMVEYRGSEGVSYPVMQWECVTNSVIYMCEFSFFQHQFSCNLNT